MLTECSNKQRKSVIELNPNAVRVRNITYIDLTNNDDDDEIDCLGANFSKELNGSWLLHQFEDMSLSDSAIENVLNAVYECI